MPTKENRAGEQQPYIAKGNGPESGEYTNKDTSTKSKSIEKHSKVILSEGCTKEELEKLLTLDEHYCINTYSDYFFGVAINKHIRDKTLTEDEIWFINEIKKACSKHKMRHDLVVYRGIRVDKDVFVKFAKAYLNNEILEGSVLCSTSYRIVRAIRGTQGTDNKTPILFKTVIPKGYQCLPIEEIAKKRNECEVLIYSPKYRIRDIIYVSNGPAEYYQFEIELVR